MRVERLQMTNLRAVETAVFHFQPGFNLIVGVNGVGKTTALHALAECLAQALAERYMVRKPADAFEIDDIRAGADAFTIECDLVIDGESYHRLYHKQRSKYSEKASGAGNPRETVHATPDRAEYVGPAPPIVATEENVSRGVGVFFSTRRAVPTDKQPPKSAAAGGYAAAFGDAFANRELRLAEFASWLKTRQALAHELPTEANVLVSLKNSIQRFLPHYANLRPDDEDKPSLLIDRGGATLPVKKLSDGERGLLALVLDLTRRLSQANATGADPAAEAEAIVLIDEIELHLHPKWQRQAVKNLSSAFPNCQFIVTTHSPQIIGEVENDHIQILDEGEVYSPGHSYGMPSNRVLEEIMESPSRTKEVEEKLNQASAATANEDHATAKALLAELVEIIGEDDPDVIRIRSLLSFMEGDDG